MNRAFYIVIAPGILVAAVYLAMNWGHVVPRWVAFTVAGVAAIGLAIRAVRARSAAPR